MATSRTDAQAPTPAARVQDDLYRHVNGEWLDSHVIPPDRGSDGVARALYDQAERQVRAIIEACDPADATDRGRIGRLYASFLDEQRVEDCGTAPLDRDLEAIAGADSRAELAAVVGQLQRRGVGGAVELMVDTDPGDPTQYRIFTCQSGLGLPDESYYREDKYADIRAAYVTHIASMLALAGLPGTQSPGGAAAVAARVMETETSLAAGHWDVVQDRDESQTYNPMTLAALIDAAPGFAWKQWITGMQCPAEAMATVIVREPSYMTHLGQVWQAADVATLKEWVTWRLLHSRAPYLTSGIVAENFAFYGTTLQGTQQLRDRWKRGVALVEAVMGEAVGHEYVTLHFPPRAKERMEHLVDTLIEAYRLSISQLSWMSEGTRAKALDKLAKFTPKIGYPDRWRDYSGLKLDAADLVGNVAAASAFEQDYQLAKIGRPVDRGEWFMTPQTVNAYYNPGMNEIVFPAAILQPPFFTLDGDDAANYGGIGAIIGHEIGHGFDDQGSKYDGDGRLADWWTQADRDEFDKRTAALIAQFDAYVPTGLSPEHHVNGALTIGENIGDLGGLSIALKAYQLSLEGREAPVVDGQTGIARVFLSYALAWRTATRPELLELLIATDPHSPAEFRCNGAVRNIPEFYDAFGVCETDALYLPPEQRVSIWS